MVIIFTYEWGNEMATRIICSYQWAGIWGHIHQTLEYGVLALSTASQIIMIVPWTFRGNFYIGKTSVLNTQMPEVTELI
jgi:hypothetical protein